MVPFTQQQIKRDNHKRTPKMNDSKKKKQTKLSPLRIGDFFSSHSYHLKSEAPPPWCETCDEVITVCSNYPVHVECPLCKNSKQHKTQYKGNLNITHDEILTI